MPADALTSLVDLLQQLRLLEPEQLAALPGLQQRFPDPRALAKELVALRWLTTYQANQLVAGNVKNLLLGPYALLEKIGEGGMGQVYRARQQRLGRIDAIKVIRKERLEKPDAIKRFYREIRAASALKHPNIVHAYDADEVDGTHYFAMEFVEGTDLARVVKKRGPLPVAEACEYIRQVACGLQHAFERGLVHRDIKPHNLLLARGGRKPPESAASDRNDFHSGGSRLPLAEPGIVKILDLGLARIVAGPADEKSSTMTQEGTVMGTPDYMAPEQTIDSHTVDIRADLYSLGCTLYFLLTGRAPFPGGSLGEKLVKHQLHEPEPIARFRSDVPTEVVEIVQRLMKKRREERFQTPGELAEVIDGLTRTRSGELIPDASLRERTIPDEQSIGATPPESANETVPFVEQLRRKRLAAQKRLEKQVLLGTGVGVALMLLVLGIWGLTRLFRDNGPALSPEPVAKEKKKPPDRKPERKPSPEEQEREFQAKRAAEAEAAYPALEAKFKGAGEPGGVSPRWESFALEVAAFKGKHGGTPAAIKAAELLMKLPSPLDQLDPKKLPQDCIDHWRAGGVSPPSELVGVLGEHRGRHWEHIGAMACSSDGKLVASCGSRLVRLWNAETFLEQGTFDAENNADVYDLAFSPDSRRLVIGCYGLPRVLQLWDVEKRQRIRFFNGHTASVYAVAYSSDGRRIVSSSEDHTVRLWDVETGQQLRVFAKHSAPVRSVAISRDGTRIVSGGNDQAVRIWDAESGAELRCFEQYPGSGHAVLLSADHRRVVAAGGQAVVIWDIETGKEWFRLGPHSSPTTCVALTADERLLFSGCTDGSLWLWDLNNGQMVRRWQARGQYVSRISLLKEGRLIASSGHDGTVRLWDVDTGKEVQPLTGPVGATTSLAFSPDCKQLLTHGDQFRFWGLPEGRQSQSLPGPSKEFSRVAFSPDGRSALLPSKSNVGFSLLDLETGKEWDQASGRGSCLSPDGRRVLSGGNDCTPELWDVATRQLIRTFPRFDNHCLWTAYSPDGRRCVTGRDPELRLYEVETGTAIGTFNGTHPVFSADGRMLFTAECRAQRHRVLRHDLVTKQELAPLAGHTGDLQGLAVSPDGKALVSAALDGRVMLWDPATGAKLREWQLPGPVHAVAFANDGRHLATANGNGTVYILRIDTRRADAAPLAVSPEQAKQQQLDAAQALGVAVTIENSIALKLNLIPAGKFLMGSAKGEAGRRDDEDQREVQITKVFYLGVFEVNQAQYRKLMTEVRTSDGGPDHPVDHVFWSEAVEFCRRLSELPPEKLAGRVYRLPHEEEWEYACRAGTTTPFAFGTSLSSLQANFNGKFPYGGAPAGPNRFKTTTCGSFQANAWGFFDMHGNVWEWCSDWHAKE